MKELLSYIFLMGEKVKLRNQLAFFLKFLLCPTGCSYRYQACCIRIGTRPYPNRLLCFICREFHRFFHGTLVVYMFCWMVLFIYEDGIS